MNDWGENIWYNFGKDPNQKGVPDPKQIIKAYPSLEALQNHKIDLHGEDDTFYMSGEKLGRIHDFSFKFQKNLNQHVEIEHADHDMTKQQFYDFYLKYHESYYHA